MNRQRVARVAGTLFRLCVIGVAAGCSGTPVAPSEVLVGIASSESRGPRLMQAQQLAQQLSDIVATIQQTSPQASETGPTAGGLTVFLSYYSAEPLTVSYTVGGTATTGDDYTALPGTVTVPAGQTIAPISIMPIDDSHQEAAETVVVTLTGGTGYAIGNPGSGTVTIADNDTMVKCRCSTISYEFEPGGAAPKWGAYLVSGNSKWRVGFRINVKCTGTGTSNQCTVFQNETGTLNWTIGGKSGEVKGQQKKVTKFHKGKFGDPWEKEYSDALGADYPPNSTEMMTGTLNMEFELKCVSSDGQSISKRFKVEGSFEAKAATKGGQPSVTGADPKLTPLN